MTDPTGGTEALDVLIRRIDILRRLSDRPAHKRDLADEMDYSRSTINRAVRELADLDLVERCDRGITATAAGRVAVDHLAEFQAGLDDIVDANPVIAPLPRDSALSTAVLTDAETVPATDPIPYRALERFHDSLASAERYRALFPALDDPRHVRLLYEHVVTRDRPADLVVTPSLFDTLRTQFPHRTAAMAEREGFRIRVADTVPQFALTLLEEETGPSVAVVVFTGNGSITGTLYNDSPDAVAWATDRFRGVWNGASDRTAELIADVDGGAVTDATGEPAPLGQSLPVSLESQGFVRLGLTYFREEPVADPATAWRAGLSLTEVHTGYAVERSQPGTATTADDAPELAMTEQLVATLESGTDCLVVGPPGSGKSTLCKRVACEWYDHERGTVVYREGGRGQPFDAVDDLAVTVRAVEGHSLVVVEDAVRAEADGVFEAIDRLADSENVSFLLDARTNEWTDLTGRDVPALEVVTMPPLDEADARRLVEQFEWTIGESIDVPVDRLREAVHSEATREGGAEPNDVLLLLHRLATYADPLTEEATSLEEAVATVYDHVAGDEDTLDVAVLANALNAAGVEIDPGMLYAVADPAEFDAVEAAIDFLDGRVLFSRDGGYRTVHESWSVAFLAHLVETEGERAAAERFGDCVSALLALADHPDRCDQIVDRRTDQLPLAPVIDDPDGWADDIVESVYALGRRWPKLAVLFGTGESDSVRVPAACSPSIAAERPVWLGRAFEAGGYYDRAQRAFERLSLDDPETAIERLIGLSSIARHRGNYDDAVAHARECLSLIEDADRPIALARAQQQLGKARVHLSEFEEAERALQAARESFEAAGDRRRLSTTLHDLGIAAAEHGALDRACTLLRRSLELRRAIDDRLGETHSLVSLGNTLRLQDEYDRAHELLEQALDISREVGDQQSQADALNNLGIIAGIQADYDRALDYFDRSLELKQRLDDSQGVANTHHNLGNVARRLGKYDRAREHFRQSLDIKRDLGNSHGEVTTLNNLGELARRRGEYERAREYHERSLALSEEIDHRPLKAEDRSNLGELARLRGEHDRARDALERALDIAMESGKANEVLRCHRRLGKIARDQGAYDRADDQFRKALDAFEDDDDPFETTQVRLARGRLALDRGDVETARDRAAGARETFETMGSTPWVARSRRLLGRVAAESGDVETAREHWLAALDTFEEVGARRDALDTLQCLVDTCHDEDRAAEWREQADQLLADLPDPVADDHRDWLAEFGGL